MSDFTPGIRRYLDELRQVFDALNLAEMDAVAQVFQRAYEEGRTIFVLGNGGSAATTAAS
jgi:D-sedoheptulose 7-phosphate isomerase